MTIENLAERAAAISWWHGGMDLGQGIVTRGESMPAFDLLPRLDLPPKLTEKTVLDVGSWDGFMAFECERRGAKRVVAIDAYVWHPDHKKDKPGSTGRAGFDLARAAYQSNVEAVECEVLDISPSKLGTFSIVLFLGVLYHMRHPLLALEKVAAVTDELLIVESHIIGGEVHVPMMRFYPHGELNGDVSNWWGPNAACVRAMLHDVGFANIHQTHEKGGRAVFHARRAAGDS
jgi:tRNA (mo5U34)-methyltransferase